MTWISVRTPGSILSPAYTPPGATLGIGSVQPLSSFFATLGAAQAFYPNAGITALTQQTDRAAIAQLLHDSRQPELAPGATYMIDAVGTAPVNLATQFSKLNGKSSILQATGAGWGTGGPPVVTTTPGSHASIDDLIIDGGCHASHGFLADGALGTNGAVQGLWYKGAANSQYSRVWVQNCLGWGHYLDATAPPAAGDFLQFDSCGGTQNGLLDIWSITISAGASGTFTITLKDKYGVSHTTGAITIGTTTIGAGLSYSVAGLPNPGVTNPANTVEGIIGTALHHPGNSAGIRTYGFGSVQAQSAVYDSTSNNALAGQGTTVTASFTFYLILQGGDLCGPGPVNGGGNWITSVTNPSGGGTCTLTHVQTGVQGGAMAMWAGSDSQFVLVDNLRATANFGDGLLLQTSHNTIRNPDCETNSPGGGAGIRVQGGFGGTATVGTYIVGGDFEGNLDGVVFDTNPDSSQAGTNLGMVVYDPTESARVYKRQGGSNGDLAQSTSGGAGATIPAAG